MPEVGPRTAPLDRRPAEVAAQLRCPRCASELAVTSELARCAAGHAYRFGLDGVGDLRVAAPTVDPPRTVFARGGRLGRGSWRVAELIGQLVLHEDAAAGDGLVVDVTTGGGLQLDAVLDRLPWRSGLTLDLGGLPWPGPPHPRGAVIAADPTAPLPLADGAAGVLLDVFAGLVPAEAERLLTPAGLLVVARPTQAHLAELVRPLAVLGVTRRLPSHPAAAVGSLRRGITRAVSAQVDLDHGDIERLVDAEPGSLGRWLRGVRDPVRVTLSVRLSVYRRRQFRTAS